MSGLQNEIPAAESEINKRVKALISKNVILNGKDGLSCFNIELPMSEEYQS